MQVQPSYIHTPWNCHNLVTQAWIYQINNDSSQKIKHKRQCFFQKSKFELFIQYFQLHLRYYRFYTQMSFKGCFELFLRKNWFRKIHMLDQVLGTILFSLKKIIEVTVFPVAPPNWNLGVGSTVFTLKWVSKNVLSSSSVQLQDVIKKKLGWQEGD